MRRGSPLRRGRALRGRRKEPPSSLEEALAAQWAAGLPRRCAVTGRRASATDPMEAHHPLPREYLRRMARERGMGAEERARLLWDPRNRMAVLRSVHDRHTRAFERIPAKALTEANWEFAREVGLERVLERQYP